MQIASRWQSPPNVPGHYAEGQCAKKGVVARQPYGNELFAARSDWFVTSENMLSLVRGVEL